MPFVKSGSQLIYYAHIPKCAGSSVESYLKARFGPIALLDQGYHRLSKANRWSQTSPQHIDSAALARLLPREMIDYAFAVVRHPAKRIVSVFKFQRDVENVIPKETDFSSWLRDIAAEQDNLRFRHDNHLLPQSEFLPKDCTLFHLEHGLEPLIGYFDEIVGRNDGPAAFERVNDGGENANYRGADGQAELVLSSENIQLISQIYASDFKKLGYKPDESKPLHEKPRLVSVRSTDRDPPLSPARRLIARGLRYTLGVVERA